MCVCVCTDLDEGACTDQPKSAIFKSPWKGRGGEAECERVLATWLSLADLEVDQQVLRLDVSMDHLLSVAVVQSISQLGHILGGRWGGREGART